MDNEYAEHLWEELTKMFAHETEKKIDELQGVKVLRERWQSAKEWMIPYFDETGRRYIDLGNESSVISLSDIREANNKLLPMYESMLQKEGFKENFREVRGIETSITLKNYLFDVLQSYFSPQEIASNKTVMPRPKFCSDSNFQTGTKVSKVVADIITHEFSTIGRNRLSASLRLIINQAVSIDKIVDYFLIIFGQLVSTVKTASSKVVLSVNPMDILFASTSTAGWHSCHNILGGLYRTGTISYLLDSFSAIAFAYKTTEDMFIGDAVFKDLPIKLWRQMVFLDKNTSSAIMSREYPATMPVFSKHSRDLAAWVLAEYKGVPHDWTVANLAEMNQNIATILPNNWHYTDLPTSRIKLKGIGINPCIKPGVSSIVCVSCGEERRNGNTRQIVCDDCLPKVTCCACGDSIIPGDIYDVEGDYLCRDCFEETYFICNCCGEYHLEEDSIETIDQSYICPTCYENDYFTCEKCGEISHIDDRYDVEGEDYCYRCIDDYAVLCVGCDEYVKKENANKLEQGGDHACKDCSSECVDCGGFYLDDDLVDGLCPDCEEANNLFEQYESETEEVV